MKRILTFVFAAIMMAISCTKENNEEPYNPDGSPITQAQALEIVKEEIDEYDMVYVSKSIVKKNTKFKTYFEQYGVVPRESWVVFINTMPIANSGPFWLYIYIDPYTGNADMDSWEWGYPDSFEYDMVKCEVGASSKEKSMVLFPRVHVARADVSDSLSNNWAVIISGGVRPEVNWERYWNNCSAMYKCLRNVYNYRRDRIFVLMSDGVSPESDRHLNNGWYESSPQDLDGDGNDDINYSAAKANISTVFNYLRDHVDASEQVLIFITDHGFKNNDESFIGLWNDSSISATELAEEIKKINGLSRKHVVLGQCYSGGFIGPLSSCRNITVSASSAADEMSVSMENRAYDRFLYHWIGAAAGKTLGGAVINADRNHYEGVSVEEIFRYALDNDGTLYETPQYSSSPSPMGEKYGLSGEEFGYPVFSNPPSHMTSGEDYTASLSNLPASCTIDWTTMRDGNISFDRVSPSSVRVRKVSGSPMADDYVKAEVSTSFKTYSFRQDVYLWESGIHHTDGLIEGSLTSGTFSLPFGCPDVSSYEWMIDGVEYEVIDASTHIMNFVASGEIPEEYAVSVSFVNPLGSNTTIVRRFYQ